MVNEKIITKDKLEFILNQSIWDGYEFQRRKQPDWKENYELYRDKVITNRLTQRQSVNVPLMKQIIKTLLAKIDDFIDLEFTNLDNDKQKELLYSIYWSDVVKVDNRLELKDKVDKKQVMLFGRTFEKINVMAGMVKFHIVDPQDMRVDRFVDPTNIDSAHYVIQDNIFETISDLKNNPMYDQTVVKSLEDFFATEQGIVLGEQNNDQLARKNDAMREMGDSYVDFPQVGQTLVQIQEGFIKVYNPDTEKEEIVFTVSGTIKSEGTETRKLLFSDFLENVIDPNGHCLDHYWRYHYPYESWGEDVENRDFWCDGVADSIRTPNKIVNSWFSQMVENRTLANFGMNYYDSSAGGEDGVFIPQTFEPKAWGWYPVPGDPNQLIKSVNIPQLTGNLADIDFIVQMAQNASAATNIQQGITEPKRITLGEIQLLSSNAMDRIQSMSLYYQQAWLNIGRKYVKLLEAMGDEIEAVRVFKKGYKGTVFNKTITPQSWESDLGYDVKVISKKDKSEQDLDQIQKLQAVKSFMPMNPTLDEIIKKKLLDVAGTNPDETKQIMADEKKVAGMTPPNVTVPPSITPASNLPAQNRPPLLPPITG